jgi:glucose 1-dehydrogenase
LPPSAVDNDASSLHGQVALVTGATSGIGAGVVEALAAAGAVVGINHRRRAQAADDAVARIQRAGGRALALRADVSIERDVVQMFERLVAAFGRIDIVVANAGIQRDAPLTDMTLEQWNEVLATNLTGQFLCMREAVRRFVAQGDATASRARGKIVCIGSVHDRIPWAGHVNYAASKGGLDMLMRSIAQEVAPLRIRVNAVAPGAIKTDINASAWRTPQAEAELLKLIPYGRVGAVDDVARAVAWLASDASDYVTGTTLVVDGGMVLYPAFAHGG